MLEAIEVKEVSASFLAMKLATSSVSFGGDATADICTSVSWFSLARPDSFSAGRISAVVEGAVVVDMMVSGPLSPVTASVSSSSFFIDTSAIDLYFLLKCSSCYTMNNAMKHYFVQFSGEGAKKNVACVSCVETQSI